MRAFFVSLTNMCKSLAFYHRNFASENSTQTIKNDTK